MAQYEAHHVMARVAAARKHVPLFCPLHAFSAVRSEDAAKGLYNRHFIADRSTDTCAV